MARLIAIPYLFMALSLSAQEISLIPYPVQWKASPGHYDLTGTLYLYSNVQDQWPLPDFRQFVATHANNLQVTNDLNRSGIRIEQDSSLADTLRAEGYYLHVSRDQIVVKAATPAGLFYGLQTLRHLASNPKKLPCVEITDYPRFTWRGSMIDVARSFFSMDYLKKHIDRMALYKLNRLHLHLTDDQGWRIEIKSRPRLTEYGSRSAVKDGNAGYLSQAEYRELQAYAKKRNITIIPEVDMPGHIYAALISYPELNCPEYGNIDLRVQTPPEYYTGVQVGWNKLCLTDNNIYTFVEEVMSELASITTGPYIHLGGDEIHDPLYPEFVAKADSIVRRHGKIPIGWEEVMQGDVSEQLIAQQWHDKVDTRQNPQIVSLCQHFYLDHANYPGQPQTNNWCKEDGVNLKDAYAPIAAGPQVLGIEATVWTEHIHTHQKMDQMLWPRLCAVAEVAWSHTHDYEQFTKRLAEHASTFRLMGIHYYPFSDVTWK